LFGTPHDLRGIQRVFVDRSGQPVYWKPTIAPPYVELSEHPYEMNLVEPDGRDTPFNEQDVEMLLRPWDADATGLSTRLAGLFGTTTTEVAVNGQRRLVTHRSFSIPS